ncbi:MULTISPECIES: hypothetical protein [Photobacterium]|uniref:Uncharacterized protein n=1 Tax=Photobacterium halotolerans TaxID=265726 RepID=A0A0F5VDZ3_9GAMM|nr:MULTISPECIES: hypothetical protein [Photobacterium]KKD00022.1 hypothetical protein KY46_08975 [Photobacterium halotolerans]UIP28192.1 hypothetical protein LN341_01260 [Photobacterium sp. TLY01]
MDIERFAPNAQHSQVPPRPVVTLGRFLTASVEMTGFQSPRQLLEQESGLHSGILSRDNEAWMLPLDQQH